MTRGDNPTKKTQEQILKAVLKSKKPLTLTALAQETNKSINQVKTTIEFFEGLGLIKTISSSGKTTLILSPNQIKEVDQHESTK